MVLKYEGGDFSELLNQNERFILLLYFDGQELDTQNKVTLGIIPTTHNKFSIGENYAVMESFPSVTYVETFHSQAYDLVSHFGISHDDLWDGKNKIFRPLIISVKDGWIVKSSYGMCYCVETYIDIIYTIYPELFEPPSVSES